jgi:hypothetical protein
MGAKAQLPPGVLCTKAWETPTEEISIAAQVPPSTQEIAADESSKARLS